MLRNVSRLSLLLMVPAGLCLGQSGLVSQSAQPPPARSVADMTIPELLMRAEQLQTMQRYTDATNLLAAILQRDDTNIDALRLLGNIAWVTQRPDVARKNWLRVREIQPNDFGANLGLGRMYLQTGVYRSAINYLESAAGVAPPDYAAETWTLLGQAYRGARDRDRALEAIQKALTFDSERFDAWQVLVGLRIDLAVSPEDFDHALEDADRLVEIAGRKLQAEGTTRQGVQRLHEAYNAKLAVLSVSRAVVFERLSDGTYSDRLLPGQERRAAAIVSKTVDVMIRQADFRRTLAHFDVLELAQKAVEFDGGTNPRTLLDLGELQVATGQSEKAAETFRRVLELDPQNKRAAERLNALLSQGSSGAPRPTMGDRVP